MITKIALLALCAVVTWWLTRPQKSRRASRENKKLSLCAKCGVYHEAGVACECDKK